jgi:hypothetical protein
MRGRKTKSAGEENRVILPTTPAADDSTDAEIHAAA